MTKNNRIFYVIATIFAVSILCLYIYQHDNKYTHDGTQPINGVLYPSHNKVDYLVNDWIFYPNAELTPRQVASYDGYRKLVDITGKNAMESGVGTYRLVINLGDSHPNYAFQLPEIYSSCNVYFNQDLVLSLGDVSSFDKNFETKDRILILPDTETVDILISVGSSSGVYWGMVHPPAVGDFFKLQFIREFRLISHSASVFVAIIGIGLFMVFALKSSVKKGVWGILLCLLLINITGYPIVHSFFTIQSYLFYIIEYISHYLLMVVVILFVCSFLSFSLKHTFLFSFPCMIGSIVLLFCFIFPSIENNFLITFFITLIKIYAPIVLIYLLIKCFSFDSQKSTLIIIGTISYIICLIWSEVAPLHDAIYGGWYNEVGSVFLICFLCADLWLDAVSAYKFKLNHLETMQQMKSRLKMQKEHYAKLTHQVEQTRQAHHNMRQHMRVLSSLAHGQKYDEVLKYLDEYTEHLNQSEPTIFTENTSVDAILNHYSAVAQSTNTVYDIHVNLPTSLHIPDDELCVILGNLLENATEATSRQANNDRKIYLRIAISNNQLGIIMENSFDGVVIKQKDLFCSRKRDGFGIGIESIISIVKSYNGLCDFYPDKNVFNTLILIPLK